MSFYRSLVQTIFGGAGWCILCGTLAAAESRPAEAPAEETALERAFKLDEGKELKRDAAKAATLYAAAAEAGDPYAHLRLGYMYEVGDGVTQDYQAARSHYQAAADAGLPEGRLHLAFCYLEGWGGPTDRVAFAREVRAAADAGNIDAEQVLAAMYFIGLGVARNQGEAVKWLEQAAKMGAAHAAVAVGREVEGKRVRSLMGDDKIARSWYQLSAEKDYTEGMRAMARTFLSGRRSDRNWEMGQKWLQMASDNGDPEAPYTLAVCEMLHVDSPTHDEARATEYLKLAAERGNERATEVLQLQLKGRPLVEAFRYVLETPYDERYVQRSLSAPLDTPTHPPSIYRVVRPVYPTALQLIGTAGNVVVDFVVDTTGRVQNAYALKSSHPLFSERAVRAVEQWRFYPARKDGRLVKTHMQVPVVFQLEGEQLAGVDELLQIGVGLAQNLGPEVAADATELRMGRTIAPLVTPKDSSGNTLTARVMVLLVIDDKGTPIRGHVLQSQPESAGSSVLASAMAGRYIPRQVDHVFVESHVLLIYSAGEKTEAVFK